MTSLCAYSHMNTRPMLSMVYNKYVYHVQGLLCLKTCSRTFAVHAIHVQITKRQAVQCTRNTVFYSNIHTHTHTYTNANQHTQRKNPGARHREKNQNQNFIRTPTLEPKKKHHTHSAHIHSHSQTSPEKSWAENLRVALDNIEAQATQKATSPLQQLSTTANTANKILIKFHRNRNSLATPLGGSIAPSPVPSLQPAHVYLGTAPIIRVPVSSRPGTAPIIRVPVSSRPGTARAQQHQQQSISEGFAVLRTPSATVAGTCARAPYLHAETASTSAHRASSNAIGTSERWSPILSHLSPIYDALHDGFSGGTELLQPFDHGVSGSIPGIGMQFDAHIHTNYEPLVTAPSVQTMPSAKSSSLTSHGATRGQRSRSAHVQHSKPKQSVVSSHETWQLLRTPSEGSLHTHQQPAHILITATARAKLQQSRSSNPPGYKVIQVVKNGRFGRSLHVSTETSKPVERFAFAMNVSGMFATTARDKARQNNRHVTRASSPTQQSNVIRARTKSRHAPILPSPPRLSSDATPQDVSSAQSDAEAYIRAVQFAEARPLETLRRELMAQAELLARINHGNIATYVTCLWEYEEDHGRADGVQASTQYVDKAQGFDAPRPPRTLFLMSALYKGGSLQQRFDHLRAKNQAFENDQITSCMVSLTCALDYVHREMRMSHNNVSLGAILYDIRGNFKLGSFVPSAVCEFHTAIENVAAKKARSPAVYGASTPLSACTRATASPSRESPKLAGAPTHVPTLGCAEVDDNLAGEEAGLEGNVKFGPENDVWCAGAVLLELCTMKQLELHAGVVMCMYVCMYVYACVHMRRYVHIDAYAY
jgi:hypothetical protein